MNTEVSKLTPTVYSCLDTIQEIVTKLGGPREINLAIASLGNSHPDAAVLAELQDRCAALVDPPADQPGGAPLAELAPPAGFDAEAEKLHRERRMTEFTKELEHLINCKSLENGSNTPDFMLAEFLSQVMAAFDTTVNAREKWYGRAPQGVPAPVTA